jgi:hypothetical protein
MLLTILTLLSALSISAVAIFYSIAGLAAIFAGAAIPIMVMGSVLEVGKLVTASWLYQNWKLAPRFLKFYLTIAVLVLMFITSMGIFGFLSKAHVEQTAPSTLIVQKIEQIDERITRENFKVERFTNDIDRLNTGTNVRVDTLIDTEQDKLESIYARIDKEIADITAIANTNISTQKERIEQAKARADRDIAQLNEARKKTWGKKRIDDEIRKIRDNELAVASKAQAEILKIQNKLNDDIREIKDNYQPSIDALTSSVSGLTSQANETTAEISIKAEELEGKLQIAYTNINELNEEKFILQSQIKQIEIEVGPIKYIAEFVYGQEADADMLERAVRWVIIIIIFVFDPLAVLLLIAANYSLRQRFGKGFGDIAEDKLGGSKLDDYWKDRYQSMKDDLGRFNEQKSNEDVAVDMPEVTYNLGEVNADTSNEMPVEDYMDEIAYDINDTGDLEISAEDDEVEIKQKHYEKLVRTSKNYSNQLEEFKRREQEEKEVLEEVSRKAIQEDNESVGKKEEEEPVSIKEDEVTPTIIEDVKITDLSDEDVKKKTYKSEKEE